MAKYVVNKWVLDALMSLFSTYKHLLLVFQSCEYSEECHDVSVDYTDVKQKEAHTEKFLVDNLCLSLFCMVKMNNSY